MNKAALMTVQEASHKARAEHFLAETQKILHGLASDLQRTLRRPRPQSNLIEQVKEILQS